ncbi:hypothetical protein M1D48_05390 [Erwinia sp. D4-22]
MPKSFSLRKRAGFSLLTHSALSRSLYISLLLAALWAAIHWADALA